MRRLLQKARVAYRLSAASAVDLEELDPKFRLYRDLWGSEKPRLDAYQHTRTVCLTERADAMGGFLQNPRLKVLLFFRLVCHITMAERWLYSTQILSPSPFKFDGFVKVFAASSSASALWGECSPDAIEVDQCCCQQFRTFTLFLTSALHGVLPVHQIRFQYSALSIWRWHALGGGLTFFGR